jgi:hypothetical protein
MIWMRFMSAKRPTLSLVLIADDAAAPAPAWAQRALAKRDAVELLRVDGGFAALGGALAEAVGRATGDLVWLVTPDCDARRDAIAQARRAAQEEPDAGVFVLPVKGLAADPAWRGRRCRSHERNVESLRFAQIVAPGGVVARRALLQPALAGLPESEDWWRAALRRMSAATRFQRLPLAVRRRARLAGEPPCPSFAPPAGDTRPRVLILGQIEVSTSLYFDFLEAEADLDVAFRPLTDLAADGPHLAAADLVILVRELHRFWDEGVIDFLRAAGTPFVHFTDDNFLVMQAEDSGVGFYTAERMRAALAGAAELWTSTPAMAEAFARLHPEVRVWGPVMDRALIQPLPAPARTLTIGIPGSDFRAAGLGGLVLDELRALAAHQKLRIIATDAAADALEGVLKRTEIDRMPKERSFRQFVRQWRREGIDILLHPAAGATGNAPFKCPTAAIVASYLGAIPVVADEPAYVGWGEPEGVLRLEDGGLTDAARGLKRRNWRAGMRERLASSLALRLGAEGRADVLRDVMGPLRAEGGVPAAAVLASPAFGFKRAARQVIRVTRRLRDRLPG